MEHRGEFTMEQNRASPKLRGERWQATAREGKIRSKTVTTAHPFENVSSQKRAKSSKVTEITHFKTPGQNRRKVTVRDAKHTVADRATK